MRRPPGHAHCSPPVAMLTKIFFAAVVIAIFTGYVVRQPSNLAPRPVKLVADEPAGVLCIDNTAATPLIR